MDRRVLAIIGLLAGIVVLLVILLIVVANDDGGGDVATTSTTGDQTTTSEDTTTTSAETTTTTEATTTTTTSTTTTTTTTTTTAPPPTVPPEDCTGRTGPTDPEPVAQVFYEAWTLDDRGCAEEVAGADAIDTLFAIDGTDANWTFQGCRPVEGPEPHMECAFSYEGGAAFFVMQYGALDGWQIVDVDFVAD